MSDFYSDWLEQSKANEKAVAESPRFTRSKDLKWVRTPQDFKAALMIAPELGFTTGGSCMMRAEIPVGWHTGKHLHGEEAIYVESGDGFMILDDKRYDFHPGTIIHVPYRSPHQLFNTGNAAGGLYFRTGLASGSRRLHGQDGTVGSLRRKRSKGDGSDCRKKSRSIGPKTDGGSRCIRIST